MIGGEKGIIEKGVHGSESLDEMQQEEAKIEARAEKEVAS